MTNDRQGGRKLVEGLLVGSASAALALVLWAPGWLDGTENLSWRARVVAQARPSASTPNIKLILLNQASLDWGEREQDLGGWPWPRETLAAIIDFCSEAGARAIAIDVLLSESAIHDVFQDQLVADAIDRAANVAVPIAFSRDGGAHATWPLSIAPPPAMAGWGDWPGDTLAIQAAWATFPVPEIAEMSTVLGNVMAAGNDQAEITRVPAVRLFDGQSVPTLGLAAYRAANPEATLSIEKGRVQVGRLHLPLDAQARTILRFRGPATVYSSFSAASVLQSQIRILEGEAPTLDPATFRDAWVFYGYSAPALMDLRPTPLSPVAPGVSIHATLLDNLLQGDAIREATRTGSLLAIILPALIGGALMRLGTRARHSLLTILVVLPLPFGVGMLGYTLGIWVPVAAPTVAVLAALVGGVTLNYALEGRARIFIRNAFEHYLSPAVIEHILQDPARLRLGGERRELTVLFSDLQGFSSISEHMDPADLIELLNDCLSDMTTIMLEEDGTLDKYEGDAIIAFWNAPLDQADHAARACRAALRCQQRLAERREEFQRRSGHALHMRIGIHTGPAVVGNMGSHERFDYTVLGDAANLASRLEGANKVFGTFTLVSESTWIAAGDSVPGRSLGSLRVVGRTTPVRVFELSDSPPEDFVAALQHFETGDLPSAAGLFATIPDDPVAAAYLHRCHTEDAAAPDWDPTWHLTTK